ncbi:MAG: PIN domain-containing protein [Caldilinea sp. CFX5]|nr:PIN domain-containing protein [Caldilinea sp. CFX5]
MSLKNIIQATSQTNPHKLSVFLDADVIFAGSASPTEHSASQVVLLMGEITLLDCITSQQAVTEVERNLQAKLPAKLPDFRLLVSRCLRIVPDPTAAELAVHTGWADPKDLPLLVAALRERCTFLLSFNTRHYFPQPGTITVQRPGDFLQTVRSSLSQIRSIN